MTRHLPLQIHSYELKEAFKHEALAVQSVPLHPALCPPDEVKLCTYHRWFSRLMVCGAPCNDMPVFALSSIMGS